MHSIGWITDPTEIAYENDDDTEEQDNNLTYLGAAKQP